MMKHDKVVGISLLQRKEGERDLMIFKKSQYDHYVCYLYEGNLHIMASSFI